MGRLIVTGKKGWELGMAAFALLVLGGSAYFMSQNRVLNYKTGASNVVESTTGILVKKDTPAFSPCKDVTTPYGIIGIQKDNTVHKCLPLVVSVELAEPLVGTKITVNGTTREDIFYATSIFSVATPHPLQDSSRKK